MTRIKVLQSVEDLSSLAIYESDVVEFKTMEYLDYLAMPNLNEEISDVPKDLNEEEKLAKESLDTVKEEILGYLRFQQIMLVTLQEKYPTCEYEILICYIFQQWAQLTSAQRENICQLAIFPDPEISPNKGYDLAKSNQAIQCLVNEILEINDKEKDFQLLHANYHDGMDFPKEQAEYLDTSFDGELPTSDQELHFLTEDLLDLEEEMLFAQNASQDRKCNIDEEKSNTEAQGIVNTVIKQEFIYSEDFKLDATKVLEENLKIEPQENSLANIGNFWNIFPKKEKGDRNVPCSTNDALVSSAVTCSQIIVRQVRLTCDN